MCAGAADGVIVHIPGTSFDARTDSAGSFHLSYVQPGTYTLVALRGGIRIGAQSGVVVVKHKITDLGVWEICRDADNDGYTEDVDCNDGNNAIHPDADELCGDGLDNNC
ncbi:MAG: hypothetical protein GY774_01645 [Planctomycetes bacterium]|nr:hypothetical protein [Planctomycetota bacterium]